MDSELPNFQIAIPLILGVAIFSVALILLTVGLLLKVRRRAVTTGVEAYSGKVAVVIDDFVGSAGRVQMDGALWQAHLSRTESLKKGDKVTVTRIDGLTLTVIPDSDN
ncbi:putative membrane-bound clpP-class protease [Vibrio ishigakensis]|uniref:Putative membrane-bound clpP-class protease n=1 Tax=Vibrio ishigakensis TaxID=1481914 RepID=A0A0B8QVA1_9VIBR|nr:putative membrane-bound clpP-class protease [Vibrio ishigakensis]